MPDADDQLTLYRGTSGTRLPDILEFGLVPTGGLGTPRLLWFTDSPELAELYAIWAASRAAARGETPEAVVLSTVMWSSSVKAESTSRSLSSRTSSGRADASGRTIRRLPWVAQMARSRAVGAV